MRRPLIVLAVIVALVLLPGTAALADDGISLEVTGTQATEGKVTFYLAARGVPASELTPRSVAVNVAGNSLPIQVEQFASTGPGAVRKPRGVVLVFDTSGSMNEGNLLETARAAAAAYAAGLPADVELGLVTFADTAATAVSPTTDRSAFSTALGGLTATGATALYDGVERALGLLGPTGRYSERRVVVLSDGRDTASKTTPTRLAATIGVARATLDVVAITAEAASSAVSQLATGAGGQLISATDPTAARKAFRALASALSAPVLVTATVPVELSGRNHQLMISLTTADGAAATGVPVRFGVDPRASPAREYVKTPPMSRAMLWAGVAAIGLALLLAVTAGLHMALGRSPLSARLRQVDGYTAGGVRAHLVKEPQQGSPLLRKALELSEKAVERNSQRGRIAASLERAGIDLRPAEWYLLRTGASLMTGLALALLLPWWIGLPVGLIAGWFGSLLYRSMREGRRARKFADLLPDALQLVVSALRSGFSLAQALDAVVREGPEPINVEFGRAIAETRLGGELEDALERAATRNSSRDLSWLVMAIRIQREVGGNLSEVMETATGTMRERARLVRHVRGLSAEGRMSAYVLTGMPVLVGGWMFISNAEYVRPLYTEPIGMLMLGFGVLSILVGVFWMSRIIKVEV